MVFQVALSQALKETKFLVVICLIAGAAIAAPVAYYRVTESRLWSDIQARTPFHSVHTTVVTLSPDNTALVSGDFIKRRCDFQKLTAYVTTPQGEERAAISTEPEDAIRPTGSRPSNPLAQLWGPWEIRANTSPVPSAWSIYAHHICPETSLTVTNLFAEGRWPKEKHHDR